MLVKNRLYRIILSAMFLALALVLPFLTGQIPQIGQALCPMHIPVILCGFFCGPVLAAVIGFIAPVLRFALFGMPILMPMGLSMAFELLTYGLVSGLLYRIFPKKIVFIYVSLILAMIAGRLVWGAVRVILTGVSQAEFGWEAFLSGAVLQAVPGIIVQIVLIPLLVIALRKYTGGKEQ